MPDIVQNFSLNTEQTRVFIIVQSHVQRTLEFQQNTNRNRIKPEQLLMYIGTYALFLLHFSSNFLMHQAAQVAVESPELLKQYLITCIFKDDYTPYVC